MAGCKPEYFPVVVAAVAACCERPFNLHANTTSTNGVATFGAGQRPYAQQIEKNSKDGLMGNGNRAHATIGRAVNLVKTNSTDRRLKAWTKAPSATRESSVFCFAEDPGRRFVAVPGGNEGFSRRHQHRNGVCSQFPASGHHQGRGPFMVKLGKQRSARLPLGRGPRHVLAGGGVGSQSGQQSFAARGWDGSLLHVRGPCGHQRRVDGLRQGSWMGADRKSRDICTSGRSVRPPSG